MSLGSVFTGVRVFSVNGGRAIASRSRLYGKALWGEIKDEVAGELTEQAFGLLGNEIINVMMDAVANAPVLPTDNASQAGIKAHKQLTEEIKKNADDFARKFGGSIPDFRIDADIYFHNSGQRAFYKEKGSMALDVIIYCGSKVLIGFDLKTGSPQRGTTKKKATDYIRRHAGAPMLDIYIKRKH